MKGRVVMRFVGNRQEPEPLYEGMDFGSDHFKGVVLWPHGVVTYPPDLPKEAAECLKILIERAEKASGGKP